MQGIRISTNVVQLVLLWFCLSVCTCFGSFDYKLFTAETVHYQTYIHKRAKWSLSECTRKMLRFFFQATKFEFLRELLETLYLKICYLNNIWVFTIAQRNGVLLIQCKTWWGLSHVGSTKEVQEIFPCLTGMTNVLWSNLLSATLRIFTPPFQFSFECAFLHHYRGSLPGQKKTENSQVFPSTSITVTSNSNCKTSFVLRGSYHWSDQMEKKKYMYPILLRRPI